MRIIHYLFLILFFAISGCYKHQQKIYISNNPVWLDFGKAFSSASSDEVFYFIKCREEMLDFEYKMGFGVYSYSKQYSRWRIWHYIKKNKDFSVLEEITDNKRIKKFHRIIQELVLFKRLKNIRIAHLLDIEHLFWVRIYSIFPIHYQKMMKNVKYILVSAQSLSEKKQRTYVFKKELNTLQLAKYNYLTNIISSSKFTRRILFFDHYGYGYVNPCGPLISPKKDSQILPIKIEQEISINKIVSTGNNNQNLYSVENEQQVPKIKILSPKNNHHTIKPEVLIEVNIDGRTSPIKEIAIYVNKKQIELKEGPVRIHDPFLYRIQNYYIPLNKRNNNIKIVATNENNLTNFDNITVVRDFIKPKGTLYLLSIGVNELENIPNSKLDYAANDAIDIANLMNKMKGTLYKDVKTFVFTDISKNKKPYYKLIMNTMYNNLSYQNQSIKEDDTVMIFLAGHGVTKNYREYLFLPRDANISINGNYDMTTVIKWSEINNALYGLKCKKILILDTCYTDGVDMSYLMMSDKSKNKMIIFSSTSKKQKAEECKQYTNGCFTHALKLAITEGLTPGNEISKDGKLDISELKVFVTSKMAELGINQTPELSLPYGFSNLVFYVNP